MRIYKVLPCAAKHDNPGIRLHRADRGSRLVGWVRERRDAINAGAAVNNISLRYKPDGTLCIVGTTIVPATATSGQGQRYDTGENNPGGVGALSAR